MKRDTPPSTLTSAPTKRQPAAFLFWKTQSHLAKLALRLQHLLHLKRLNRKDH